MQDWTFFTYCFIPGLLLSSPHFVERASHSSCIMSKNPGGKKSPRNIIYRAETVREPTF